MSFLLPYSKLASFISTLKLRERATLEGSDLLERKCAEAQCLVCIDDSPGHAHGVEDATGVAVHSAACKRTLHPEEGSLLALAHGLAEVHQSLGLYEACQDDLHAEECVEGCKAVVDCHLACVVPLGHSKDACLCHHAWDQDACDGNHGCAGVDKLGLLVPAEGLGVGSAEREGGWDERKSQCLVM